jgi:hypothetical protein
VIFHGQEVIARRRGGFIDGCIGMALAFFDGGIDIPNCGDTDQILAQRIEAKDYRTKPPRSGLQPELVRLLGEFQCN